MVHPFHGTLEQVAKSAGVSRRTLQYWLKQPQFQERMKEMRTQAWQEALDNLTGILNTASGVLASLLKSESELIRLRASLGIITASLKAHEEFELEERISALEAALANRRNGGEKWQG